MWIRRLYRGLFTLKFDVSVFFDASRVRFRNSEIIRGLVCGIVTIIRIIKFLMTIANLITAFKKKFELIV